MMSALSTKDTPQEMLDAQQVSLVSTGASGAYLHGLEDEFLGNSKLFKNNNLLLIFQVFKFRGTYSHNKFHVFIGN